MNLSPRWTYAAALTRTKLPQFASLVPVLGYAVLWGDWFQAFLMKFSTLGPSLWFSAMTRISLLYVGGVYILGGLLIFWLACPRPLRLYRSRRQYVEAVRGDRDTEECARAGKALRPIFDSMPKGPPGRRLIHGILVSEEELGIMERQIGAVTAGAAIAPLTAYYELLDRRHPVISAFCLFMLIFGAFLFLLPSLEVFVMAINHLSDQGWPWSLMPAKSPPP
jgi:hypothetical protein